MISIILAAGEGTRLLPYTKNTPKSLVEINNTSMLEEQLKLFKLFKIKSYIVGGYLSDKLKNFTNNIFINKDFSVTNMVYTLFKARAVFNDDIIISYGDILFTRNILNDIINSNDNIVVASDMNWRSYWSKRIDNPIDDLETFKTSENKILDLGGKAKSIEEIQGQFIGLLKISKNFLNDFIKTYDDCIKKKYINNKPFKKAFMTDFIQELINRNFEVNFIKMYDPWIEIDTVDDLKSNETKNRIRDIIRINNG